MIISKFFTGSIEQATIYSAVKIDERAYKLAEIKTVILKKFYTRFKVKKSPDKFL